MRSLVRSTLQRHARLTIPVEQLSDQSDLHAHGLDSMGMVNVLLALEEALVVEFPDGALNRQCFSSIAALVQALHRAGCSTSDCAARAPACGADGGA